MDFGSCVKVLWDTIAYTFIDLQPITTWQLSDKFVTQPECFFIGGILWLSYLTDWNMNWNKLIMLIRISLEYRNETSDHWLHRSGYKVSLIDIYYYSFFSITIAITILVFLWKDGSNIKIFGEFPGKPKQL